MYTLSFVDMKEKYESWNNYSFKNKKINLHTYIYTYLNNLSYLKMMQIKNWTIYCMAIYNYLFALTFFNVQNAVDLMYIG